MWLVLKSSFNKEFAILFHTRAVNTKLRHIFTIRESRRLLREILDVKLQNHLAERNLQDFKFSNRAILCGSTLLQFTIGCQWHSADTDIFCAMGYYDVVKDMLERSGYYLNAIAHFTYVNERTLLSISDDESSHESALASDSDSDVLDEISLLCDFPVRAVFEWTRIQEHSVSHSNVDVIVLKSGVADVKEMTQHIDIQACSIMYDGQAFRWKSPSETFVKKTMLHPSLSALLKGFKVGWSRGHAVVDECSTKQDFLRTDRWLHAVCSALDYARSFYTPNLWQKLRKEVTVDTQMIHFNFFHHKLSRILKYSRRGFIFEDCDVPALSMIACSMDYVNRLPWRRVHVMEFE